MKKEVRILLIGDSDVGKTSLVLSLVTEEFPSHVPLRAEEITIPADVTPEGVPTHIVDYSSREYLGEEHLRYEMQKAHVFCLVYAVDDERSLESIGSYWLPKVREINELDKLTRPVLLVGNKSDVEDSIPLDDVLPLMNDYPDIETCIECSAKQLKNISELFYYAQKAVLHPTAPLYSPDQGKLKPRCAEALRRVFKICDNDNDGYLSDHELNEFQKRCFNAPLQQANLLEVKSLLKKYCDDGIVNDRMSETGFLFLHTIFIQRGRHETTWKVLRKFGYTDQLELSDDYLRPYLNIEAGNSVELTEAGYEFLNVLFQKSDRDRDSFLSPPELADMFSVCSNIPWGDFSGSVVTNESNGWLGYDGYEALWTLHTYQFPELMLEYLAYLGYNSDARGSQLSAVKITPSRSEDRKRGESTRDVFLCNVFGPKESGKSSFLNRLIKKSEYDILEKIEDSETPTVIRNSICKVKHKMEEKFLILQEVPYESEFQRDLLEKGGGDCDLAIILYDTTLKDSFRKAVEIQHDIDRPTVFIGTKCDKKPVIQDYDYAPAEICKMSGLPPPLQFSNKEDWEANQAKVYQTCLVLAAFPDQQHEISLFPGFTKYIKMGAVLAAASLGLLLAAKFLRSTR